MTKIRVLLDGDWRSPDSQLLVEDPDGGELSPEQAELAEAVCASINNNPERLALLAFYTRSEGGLIFGDEEEARSVS